MTQTNLSPLRQTRAQLIASLPPWEQIIRGTLIRYRLTCGKPSCRCHQDPRFRHGPYWYLSVSFPHGKQTKHLLPVDQARAARQAIDAYQKLWKTLCRISEINLAILKQTSPSKRP
jgi:hypothetical protein